MIKLLSYDITNTNQLYMNSKILSYLILMFIAIFGMNKIFYYSKYMKNEYLAKLIIIGDCAVGKTNILMRYC